MKYFFLSGEASGDHHAADLIRAIRFLDEEANVIGMGGDEMDAAGCMLVQHYREMAFMGITAVLKNAGKVRRNFYLAKEAIQEMRPDVIVLIDYPTFNLRIAKWVRQQPMLRHTRIVYYIPPKVWAWKRWRVHQIARLSDRILGIFPFEEDFYLHYGYTCTYVGNPTYGQLASYMNLELSKHQTLESSLQFTTSNLPLATGNRTLALLPGSRRHEVEKCLPKMLDAAERLKREGLIGSYAVAQATSLGKEVYAGAPLYEGTAQELLKSADVAIVNSGTATLEAALLDCPQIAVYHVGAGWIAMHVLRPLLFAIRHFTLVNILAGRDVIPELLGDGFTAARVYAATRTLITDSSARERMHADYVAIRRLLHTPIPAAQRAAQEIWQLLNTPVADVC